MAITIDPQKIFGQIKQPKNIALIIIIALAIGGGVTWWAMREKRINTERIDMKREILALKYDLLACRNAPSDTVWIDRIVDYGPTKLIHPTPIRYMGPPIKEPGLPEPDTLPDPCPRNYYNDTLTYEKYVIKFEALGCLRNYRILNIKINDKFPQITRHDVIIQHDTTYLFKVKKWQWGVGGSVFVNDLNKMPGIGLEGFTIFQGKLIVGIGPSYYESFGVMGRLGYIIK